MARNLISVSWLLLFTIEVLRKDATFGVYNLLVTERSLFQLRQHPSVSAPDVSTCPTNNVSHCRVASRFMERLEERAGDCELRYIMISLLLFSVLVAYRST